MNKLSKVGYYLHALHLGLLACCTLLVAVHYCSSFAAAVKLLTLLALELNHPTCEDICLVRVLIGSWMGTLGHYCSVGKPGSKLL